MNNRDIINSLIDAATQKPAKYLTQLKSQSERRFVIPLFFANLIMILFQLVFLYGRYQFINPEVPLWYTKWWGNYFLAPKAYLYLIPAISIILLSSMIFFNFLLEKLFIRHLRDVSAFFSTLWIAILTVSLLKIIYSSSRFFEPMINPLYISLAVPFIVSFLAAYLLMPPFIDYVKSKDMITNPQVHNHPGMLLKLPSARGAGVLYAMIFIVLGILFAGFSTRYLVLYLALFFIGVISFLDDYQNTHPKSEYRILENPFIRLIIMFLIVGILIFAGIRINFIGNPFDGILFLDQYRLNFLGTSIPYLAIGFTLFWIVWIMNLLSWSNGTDGQYAGTISIASIIVALLALRFTPIERFHIQVASLALISAGISLGFVRYTWYPSKVLWGFGATACGLVITTLSIFISSKIIVSVLIMLIPFMDGIITSTRRILQKRNPLKGDRGHLHHLLLDRGWSPQKIAFTYWGATLFFGIAGVIASEKYIVQVALSLISVVGFIIVALNLQSLKERKNKQLTV